MNKQELAEEIKNLENHNASKRTWVNRGVVLELVEELDEPQKVTIPQFVADWINYCKNTFLSLARSLAVSEEDFHNYANQKDHLDLLYFLGSMVNQEKFAKAWLYGYEIEKEKRYLVKIIGITNYNSYLNYHKRENKWTVESSMETDAIRTKHTRKQLEIGGFGWVFDCTGIEIEEVKE